MFEKGGGVSSCHSTAVASFAYCEDLFVAKLGPCWRLPLTALGLSLRGLSIIGSRWFPSQNNEMSLSRVALFKQINMVQDSVASIGFENRTLNC